MFLKRNETQLEIVLRTTIHLNAIQSVCYNRKNVKGEFKMINKDQQEICTKELEREECSHEHTERLELPFGFATVCEDCGLIV